MGFLSSTASCRQYEVVGDFPDPVNYADYINDNVKTNAYNGIHESDLEACGWVSLEDHSTTKAYLVDRYCILTMRFDKKNIPNSLVKEMLAKECEAWLASYPQFQIVPSKRRAELKEAIVSSLIPKALPNPAFCDVLWDLEQKRLYIFSSSNKMVSTVEELLYRTLGDFKFDHIDTKRKFADTDDRFKDEAMDINGIGTYYLLWLLFGTASGTNNISLGDIPLNVFVNDQLTLRRDDSQSILTGPLLDDYAECRKAIMAGKAVQDATVHIDYDSENWSVRLKTDSFDFAPFVCPAVTIDVNDSVFDEGPILERVYQIKKCNELIDASVKEFTKMYFDKKRHEAFRKDLMKWINS